MSHKKNSMCKHSDWACLTLTWRQMSEVSKSREKWAKAAIHVDWSSQCSHSKHLLSKARCICSANVLRRFEFPDPNFSCVRGSPRSFSSTSLPYCWRLQIARALAKGSRKLGNLLARRGGRQVEDDEMTEISALTSGLPTWYTELYWSDIVSEVALRWFLSLIVLRIGIWQLAINDWNVEGWYIHLITCNMTKRVTLGEDVGKLRRVWLKWFSKLGVPELLQLFFAPFTALHGGLYCLPGCVQKLQIYDTPLISLISILAVILGQSYVPQLRGPQIWKRLLQVVRIDIRKYTQMLIISNNNMTGMICKILQV